MNENTVQSTNTTIEKREFKIQEDGSVELTEFTKTIVVMTAPQFSTFYRNNLKAKEDNLYYLSDEYKTKVEDEIKEIQEQIDNIKPHIEGSEKNAKLAYEKNMLDSKIKAIKVELGKKSKDVNKNYVYAILQNLKEDEKNALMSELSEDEKSVFMKMSLEFKQSKRKQK